MYYSIGAKGLEHVRTAPHGWGGVAGPSSLPSPRTTALDPTPPEAPCPQREHGERERGAGAAGTGEDLRLNDGLWHRDRWDGKTMAKAEGDEGAGIFWREADGVGGNVWEAVAVKIFKTSILVFRDRERCGVVV